MYDTRQKIWKWFVRQGSTAGIDFVSTRDAAARIRAPDNVEGRCHKSRWVREQESEERREKGGCGVAEARKVGTKEIYHRRYLAPLSPPSITGVWPRCYRRPLTREGRRSGRGLDEYIRRPTLFRNSLRNDVLGDECGSDTRRIFVHLDPLRVLPPRPMLKGVRRNESQGRVCR